MKYAVCIPTYNRPELLGIAVESLQKDTTNLGFPIFVSSDSSPEYRTKEVENLKALCNRGPSKIYYTDTERSEAYKRELQKSSGLSREVIDIAMNGGSAGANRNRLLLLACTYGADGVIFSDDDMEVENDFIEYHIMALGNTVSQFLSKLGKKAIKVELSSKLNSADLDRIIEVFSAGWEDCCYKKNIYLYKKLFRKSEYLFESIESDAANLSLTNSVYSTIPFPLHCFCEDYDFGYHAKILLKSVDGIILKGRYPISIHKNAVSRETDSTDFLNRYLINISEDVVKNLSVSNEKDFGCVMIKTIGKKIQNFVQSSELQKDRIMDSAKKLLQSSELQKKNIYRIGILYQNWTELTDATKKIDPSILEELLVTK